MNDRIQLVRICDEFGSETYRPRKEGGRVRVRQMGCHICKQYQLKAKNTQWKCIDCNMPCARRIGVVVLLMCVSVIVMKSTKDLMIEKLVAFLI